MSWRRVDGLAWTDIGEDGVIHVATYPATRVYSLATAAAVVWQYLEVPTERDELVAQIAESTGLPVVDVEGNVDDCLSQLADLGLVENR